MQTQIRLLHLIRVCTISCSAVLNKHKRKYGDDSILNIGPKYLSIHCVSSSYCSISSGSMQFSILLFQTILLAISNTTADQTIHLIRVCTISYSAVLHKHKRKYGDDSILNIGPKYSSIHCVSRSYCSRYPGQRNCLVCFSS